MAPNRSSLPPFGQTYGRVSEGDKRWNAAAINDLTSVASANTKELPQLN